MPVRKLTYKQDKFVFCKDQIVCIKGTFGCGKSLAGLIAANMECENNPQNLYLIIRKEYVDLRDSTMKDWLSEFGDRYPIVNNDVRYPNGSVLMFRHGDDLQALVNSNLGGALITQAEQCTEDDFWFLLGRLRRKQGTRKLRLECNYDGHNWIYKLFNEQKIGTLITTNTFDNEVNLPADYIEGLKKLPKRLQERHLYGTDADMEGLVFDEYSEGRHVIAPFEIPEAWDRICILDHGVTNPTAVLWIAIDHDGNLFAYREHYEKGQLVSYHANKIKTQSDCSRVVDWLIDPSCNAKINQRNGQFYSIVDEYQEAGITFRPADNAVLAGINRVNEFFKSGRLFIFKNCVNLIDEVGQYKWQRLKPGEQKNEPDQPVKKHDHLCDCLRYGVMSRPSESERKREVKEGTAEFYERMDEAQREQREYVEQLLEA